MRNAEELSMQTTPAAAASGTTSRDTLPPAERVTAELLHGELLVAEPEPLARRARRGEQDELVERERPLLEDLPQLASHRAGRPDHCHSHGTHATGNVGRF